MSMQIVQRIPSAYANYTNVTGVIHIPVEAAQRRSYTYPIELQDSQEYVVALVASNEARQWTTLFATVQVRGPMRGCSPLPQPTPWGL